MKNDLQKLTVLCALLASAGCSASVQSNVADASTQDVTAPQDVVTPHDVATQDAPPVDRATTPDASRPVEQPSRARVRFTFTGALGYVVTAGMFCAHLQVGRVLPDDGTEPVALDTGFQCGCECPRPLGPSIVGAQAFSTASPATVTWDGRALALYTREMNCGFGPPMQLREGVLQPVRAGGYRATFVVLDALPTGCTEGSEGRVSCSMQNTTESPTGGAFPLCPGGRMVSVTFSLPESGEVTVPVPTT